MSETRWQCYANPLRIAGIAAIATGVALHLYAFSLAESPTNRYWTLAVGTAGTTTLGLLIIAAADRIAEAGQRISPRLLAGAAILALLALGGYVVAQSNRFLDLPEWMLPSAVVTAGGFAWLLLIIALQALGDRIKSLGNILGSVIIVCSLAVALHRADRAFLYPLQTFLESAIPSCAIGLIVVTVSNRPWSAPVVSNARLLSIAFVALLVIYVAQVIWWGRVSDFRIPTELILRFIAGFAATALVGLVLTGLLPWRIALVAAAAAATVSVGSSAWLVTNLDENRLLLFGFWALHPTATAIFAAALSIAFESNRSEETTIDEPEEDFGPPLPAWR